MTRPLCSRMVREQLGSYLELRESCVGVASGCCAGAGWELRESACSGASVLGEVRMIVVSAKRVLHGSCAWVLWRGVGVAPVLMGATVSATWERRYSTWGARSSVYWVSEKLLLRFSISRKSCVTAGPFTAACRLRQPVFVGEKHHAAFPPPQLWRGGRRPFIRP